MFYMAPLTFYTYLRSNTIYFDAIAFYPYANGVQTVAAFSLLCCVLFCEDFSILYLLTGHVSIQYYPLCFDRLLYSFVLVVCYLYYFIGHTVPYTIHLLQFVSASKYVAFSVLFARYSIFWIFIFDSQFDHLDLYLNNDFNDLTLNNVSLNFPNM